MNQSTAAKPPLGTMILRLSDPYGAWDDEEVQELCKRAKELAREHIPFAVEVNGLGLRLQAYIRQAGIKESAQAFTGPKGTSLWKRCDDGPVRA